jgi:peroxiredoxin
MLGLVVVASGCNKALGETDQEPEKERAFAASPARSGTTSVTVGADVPDVTLVLPDGFPLKLSGLRGKVVALLFCAPSASSDCKREARGYASLWAEMERLGAAVVGVRAADAKSNAAWATDLHLPFDFASDLEGQASRKFGFSTADLRSNKTLLVGRDGKLRAVWDGTDPDAHGYAILALARDAAP